MDRILREINKLSRQKRQITIKLRELRRQAEIGQCEVCGKEFRRTRITKRVCSQACNVTNYRNRTGSIVDDNAIREAWPMIKAGKLLTQRNMAIVDSAIFGCKSASQVGDEAYVSRARISQILGQASRIAKTIIAMRAGCADQTTGS